MHCIVDCTYQDLVEVADNMDYLECLNLIGHKGGWLIAAPITEQGFECFELELEKSQREEFSLVLSNVLTNLDPNISSVSPSQEVDNGYIITYDDGKNTIVKNMDKIPERYRHVTDYAEHHQERWVSKKFSAPVLEAKDGQLVIVNGKEID